MGILTSEVRCVMLKVSNMVCSGKLSVSKALDFKSIISKSGFMWQVLNEDMSPCLNVKFNKNENRVRGSRKKCSCVSIWATGSIIITGVTSLDEAKSVLNKVVFELERIGELR